MTITPLVTIGVPVLDGAESLAEALESIAAQSHPNVEVIVSDNASTDDTPAIAAAFCASRPRWTYVRQATRLPAAAHFRWLYEQARGDYFMWAADDDSRSPDFVERLVAALEADPAAGLAYPDLELNTSDASPPTRIGMTTSTSGMGYGQRLRWPREQSSLVIYGLYRLSTLEGYKWYEASGSLDIALLAYVAVSTEIIHVPGPALVYTLHVRRPGESAGERRWRLVRTDWWTAQAAVDAAAACGRPRRLVPTFLALHLPHQLRRVRRLLTQGPNRWQDAGQLADQRVRRAGRS